MNCPRCGAPLQARGPTKKRQRHYECEECWLAFELVPQNRFETTATIPPGKFMRHALYLQQGRTPHNHDWRAKPWLRREDAVTSDALAKVRPVRSHPCHNQTWRRTSSVFSTSALTVPSKQARARARVAGYNTDSGFIQSDRELALCRRKRTRPVLRLHQTKSLPVNHLP